MATAYACPAERCACTRSRITVNSSTASSSVSWAHELPWAGDSAITSWAPVAPGPASAPPTIGNLLGNTRTRQPGASGVPAPVRATSGGVSASAPGQNGQSGASTPRGAFVVEPALLEKVTGRAPRPAATITSCPLSGSWRSSDIAIRLRGAGRTRAGRAGP